MRVETIEILLVCVILGLQLFVFIQTFLRILVFRKAIPKIHKLQVSRFTVPVDDLEHNTPKEILEKIGQYQKASDIMPFAQLNSIGSTDRHNSFDLFSTEPIEDQSQETQEINIIEYNGSTNSVFQNILFSTNNYLIRNRGAASDFNLIKDIVERNTNAVEEDINISIAIPLYLGLMGTMIGIVIGLFSMPDLNTAIEGKAKDILLNEGISLLIGGVKIAMIASFTGLFLTILNSGWVFKGSRNLVEKRKNELYTFVQIELLPIINHGLASTLESLQRNLLKFNNEFTINLKQLSGVFDSNAKTIRAQKELLDAIDKTKVSEMTRYNVKVMQQLDLSVSKFEKFNNYLGNVNLFVENSQHIVNRTNELLSRTDNFKTIADNLESKLNQSQQLLNFLSAHFIKLEEHKEFTSNAVADVGFTISETFKELKVHIQNSSEAVKQFTVDEIEALKKALSESKTNLSNLEHLATLNKDVSQFKLSSASQSERIKQQLEELNKNMAKTIVVLEEIESNSFTHKVKNISKSIKQVFVPKN
jgi:hypothetical protein